MAGLYRVRRPSRIVNKAMPPLAHSVARMCDIMARLPDAGDVQDDRRRSELDTLHARAREIWSRLDHLGDSVNKARASSVSRVQAGLHNLQLAYRSLQGSMIGVQDHLLDYSQGGSLRTLRHVLLSSFKYHERHAPVFESEAIASRACQCQPGLRTVPRPATLAHESGPANADSVSVLFEQSERLHLSMVETLHALPESPAFPPSHPATITARLSQLEAHLVDRQVALSALLDATGHRRTMSINLAHNIFIALGHAEGAMIGTGSRFAGNCQIMIDLVSARTTELIRFCDERRMF